MSLVVIKKIFQAIHRPNPVIWSHFPLMLMKQCQEILIQFFVQGGIYQYSDERKDFKPVKMFYENN